MEKLLRIQKKTTGMYSMFAKIKALQYLLFQIFVSHKGYEVFSSPLITKFGDEQLCGTNI